MQGPRGFDGEKGSRGENGKDGNNGNNGIPGAPGQSGNPGPPGNYKLTSSAVQVNLNGLTQVHQENTLEDMKQNQWL